MTAHQLPTEVVAFAGWLNELVGRLRPGEGWYGVFAAREPEGLRACFQGTDILPWDIAESLLRDLGERADGPRGVRGRQLYEAAATAHDRAPGAAATLTARRGLLTREAARAESRLRVPDLDDTERAWVRDDLIRARARIADLAARLARLAEETKGRETGAAAGSWFAPGTGWEPGRRAAPAPEPEFQPEFRRVAAPAPAPGPAPGPPPMPESDAAPAPVPAPGSPVAPPVRRRPRGARYAWLEAEAEPVTAPAPASVPGPPAGAVAPRGARFGGAAAPPVPQGAQRPAPGSAPDSLRAAGNAVYALRRLRAQGRSGEAHALLCEALGGPAGWLPVLAAELCAAGLAADWGTLLWEAAALPPERLAAVAGALADAGRAQDCEQLLRQGVARPVEELAGACAALRAAGREAEAGALLTAFVRCRTPEDAARLAAAGPATLTPALLEAARAVSRDRERDLRHALRVAGRA
ncbi:UL36 very large tegument protein [Streptomyces sp. NPDC004327]|uniref:UL36 very large tegument protein n=1 Tax=Streptomyces sp. NPDC004327 TaxID=3364699 RepID=UPI0036BC731B